MKRPAEKQKQNIDKVLARVHAVVHEHGGRMGRARTEVVKVLAYSSSPLSIQDIARIVHADEVSVYRTVSVLMKLALIEEIQLAGGVRMYTLASDHHDHVVCTRCGFVAHVPCMATVKQVELSVPSFNVITAHTLTYYGLCGTCAS